MKENNIFVVSLPRTGTVTMTTMLNKLGFKCKHAPSYSIFNAMKDSNAFCDTPVYSPRFYEHYINGNNKFIYIDRDGDEWYNSYTNKGFTASYTSMYNNPLNNINNVNFYSMGESVEWERDLRIGYDIHRKHCIDTIPQDKMLIYKLSDGWEPLCEFLGVDVLNEEIPHLNKSVYS